MTRRLVITKESDVQVLFLAFIGHKIPSGMSHARMGRDIKKKFEAVTVPDEQNGVRIAGKDELPEASLMFTQAEYEYLEKCLETFEYHPSAVDKVADCMDWFSAADKV